MVSKYIHLRRWAIRRLEERKRNHVFDGGRVREQHGQAVDANAETPCRGHALLQRLQKVFQRLVGADQACRKAVRKNNESDSNLEKQAPRPKYSLQHAKPRTDNQGKACPTSFPPPHFFIPQAMHLHPRRELRRRPLLFWPPVYTHK